MNGAAGNAMASLELFSGPTSWEDYEACTLGADGVDLEGQCGIKQISHLTSDFGELKRKLHQTAFPRRSTLTSVALGIAEQEIKYGRAGAAPVVVVVTDGEPISVMQTVDAAHKLQSVAKVIWVAIGGEAPVEMIEHVAQLPKHEHIIHVGSFYELREAEAFNTLINEVVTKVCPQAGSPCVLEPTSCECSLHKDAGFCSTYEAGACSELCPNWRPAPQCSTDWNGLNFCNDWCNTPNMWGCGVATLSSRDDRNPSGNDYKCDCGGCNGCPATPYVPPQVSPFDG